MTDKIIMVTLAIRLSDISDDERLNLAGDLDVPFYDIRKLDETPAEDVGAEIGKEIGAPGADIRLFAYTNVYAEIKSAKVVSAVYAK